MRLSRFWIFTCAYPYAAVSSFFFATLLVYDTSNPISYALRWNHDKHLMLDIANKFQLAPKTTVWHEILRFFHMSDRLEFLQFWWNPKCALRKNAKFRKCFIQNIEGIDGIVGALGGDHSDEFTFIFWRGLIYMQFWNESAVYTINYIASLWLYHGIICITLQKKK